MGGLEGVVRSGGLDAFVSVMICECGWDGLVGCQVFGLADFCIASYIIL